MAGGDERQVDLAIVRTAVRSGRAFAIAFAALVLAFMVALVVKGGDTVALTKTVEVSQAAVDMMALLSGNLAVLIAIVLLAFLALAPGAAAALDWWDAAPRLSRTGVRLRKVRPAAHGQCGVVRRGATGAGKALFFIGVSVLLLALAVSSRTRGAQTLLLGEGVMTRAGRPASSSYRWDVGRTAPSDAAVVAADEAVGIDDIDLALDQDLNKLDGPGALNTAACATLRIAGPTGVATASIAPWPGSVISGREAYLGTVGIAPRVVVTDPKGATVVDYQVIASLLPKGTKAAISLTPAPLVLELTAVRASGPVRVDRAPILYDALLNDPKGKTLARARLGQRGVLQARGYRVSVPGMAAWARVTLIRDPAVPWVFGAIWMIAGSALVSLVARVWPRVELLPDPDDPETSRAVRPRWTVVLFMPTSLPATAEGGPPRDGETE